MRPLATALLAAAVAALPACKRKPPPEVGADAGPPTPDQLAPGELAEGTESAFGLVLPRVMIVQTRKSDAVYAWTAYASPEDVSNYVRARITEGEVYVGTASTRYVGVRLRTKKDSKLSVEVRPGLPGSGTRTTIVVHDDTPKPLEPDVDKRLKAAGVTADGKMRDPKNRE
ncbi:MAG: hypothetical protein KC657_28090 [Myxococcales bacterium]|nr:hypothetical protein [Myxococcales bacterium]